MAPPDSEKPLTPPDSSALTPAAGSVRQTARLAVGLLTPITPRPPHLLPAVAPPFLPAHRPPVFFRRYLAFIEDYFVFCEKREREQQTK